MKIGIITACDNCNNYGAFLQMYALTIILKDMGHEVLIVLPPIKQHFIVREIEQYKKEYVLHHDKLFLLRKLWKNIRMIQKCFDTFYTYMKYRWQSREIKFCSIKRAYKKCEIIISGSDEIWNINNPCFDNGFYFGMDFLRKRKIAYAICSGDVTEKDYVNRKFMIEAMQSYDFLSARDGYSQQLIETISHKQCEIVCDPTFLPDLERIQTKEYKIKEKYILVYAWSLSENEIKNLCHFAKIHNLKIVCAMGLRSYDFADLNINVQPLAFGNVVKRADYVFAGTFHGGVFSILNHKKVIFSVKTKKLKFLLQQFEMEDRISNENMSYKEFCDILERNIDCDKIEQMIETGRKKSLDWLKMSLKSIEREKQ